MCVCVCVHLFSSFCSKARADTFTFMSRFVYFHFGPFIASATVVVAVAQSRDHFQSANIFCVATRQTFQISNVPRIENNAKLSLDE